MPTARNPAGKRDYYEVLGVARDADAAAECAQCKGSGAKPGTQPRICAGCRGSGKKVSTRRDQGVYFRHSTVCPECGGRGSLIDQPCPACAMSVSRATARIFIACRKSRWRTRCSAKVPASTQPDSQLRRLWQKLRSTTSMTTGR